MLKELFTKQQSYINGFFELIDLVQAQKILETFLNCKGKLIFSGVGKSGIVAEKLATTMTSTGTQALHMPPINALHGDVGIVSPNDVCILLSKSGQSEELLNLVPILSQKGVKTMAWVSQKESRLASACDMAIELPLEKELCPFGLAPTTSSAVQLIFGDILSVALMKRKSFSLNEYALNHPAGAIGKKAVLKVSDLMLQGDQLPIGVEQDTLEKAIIELSLKRCGCILITKGDQLVGIFTDGDLRRSLQSKREGVLKETTGALMTKTFTSISPDSLAFDALKLMEQNPGKRIMMLPVVSEEKLVGLIHMHDILAAGL